MDESNRNTLFSASEWQRYSRHVQLPQVGAEGQGKLKKAKVLIVGAGGLGCPVALYLAAAGVGSITIVDGDTIELSNLQRQILFNTQQIGKSKAESAKQELMALNPEIKVIAKAEYLSAQNASSLVAAADLTIDCSDNFPTRYLINDVCQQQQKPWIFAAIHQFSGQCSLFSSETGCFRCLFPVAPSDMGDCNAAGVLGVLPGMLGTIQANEALKYLIGQPVPLKAMLLVVDALELSFKKMGISRDLQCTTCGSGTENPIDPLPETLCSREQADDYAVTVEQFELLRKRDNYIVVDVRTDAEHAAFNIGGKSIPLAILADSLASIDSNAALLCYCQSGLRSLQAAKLIASAGIKSQSLHGGLAAWLKQMPL